MRSTSVEKTSSAPSTTDLAVEMCEPTFDLPFSYGDFDPDDVLAKRFAATTNEEMKTLCDYISVSRCY